MTDRSKYIGGSAIQSIVNVSPYKTALELWQEWIDGVEAPISEEREEFFRVRREMEPVIVGMLERRHGIVASKVSFREPNRYTDPDVDYFKAEIDFETVMTPGLAERFPQLREVPTGETLNGEIKTVNEWGRAGWGAIDQDEIPLHVRAQVLWGLGVTRRPAVLVCPLFGLDGLRVYPLLTDPITIGLLRDAALAFRRMVIARQAPAPKENDLEDLTRACSRLVGIPVDLDSETAEAVHQTFKLRAQIAALEKDHDSEKAKWLNYIHRAWSVPIDPTIAMPDDNAVLRFEGHPLAVWRRQTREGVDTKRLKEEDPMAYHRFRRDSVFRVLAKPPKGTK